MTRNLLVMILLSFASLVPGCSSASAACPGGNCSVGVWSPWGGVWYYASPCSGGKCAAKKPAPEPAESAAPELPEPAEPDPVEELVIEAQPSICEIVAQIVNRQRKGAGLPALEIDPVLCLDCESHSEWMARGGGFRHGYYTGSRECIAYGVRSPEAVVNLWLNSSGHRSIILGGGKAIGVGCSGNYWTLRVR